MAHVAEINVSRSVRVNTGQYEGTELFVSLKVVLDELDDYDQELAAAEARADKAILMAVHGAHCAAGKKPTLAAIATRHGLVLPKGVGG